MDTPLFNDSLDATQSAAFDADILQQQRQRRLADPKVQQALAMGRQLDAQLAAQEQATAAKAPASTGAAPAQAAQAPAPSADGPGFWSETGRAVIGGVRDSIQNTANFIHDVHKATSPMPEGAIDMSNQWLAAKMGLKDLELPKVAENETLVGGLARGLTQFALPTGVGAKLGGGMKVIEGAGGKAAQLVRGLIFGGAVDTLASDPYQKRAADAVLDFADIDPGMARTVLEYLKADPNDNPFEGRMKAALEGGVFGAALGGVVVPALKALKGAVWSSKGGAKDVAKSLEDSIAKVGAERESAAKQAAATPASAEKPMEITVNGVADDPISARIRESRKRQSEVRTAMNPPAADPKMVGPAVPTRSLDEILAEPRTPARPEAQTPALKSNSPEEVLQRFDERVAHAEANPPARAYLSHEGDILFSKQRPEGSIDLDTKIKAALEKNPMERSAADLVALRSYRQLQEAAYEGIIPAAGRSSDEMAAALRNADARQIEIANASGSAARRGGDGTLDPVARQALLDDVAGVVKTANANDARAVARQHFDRQAAREAAQEEVNAILANAAAAGKALEGTKNAGRIITSQSGFVSTQLLGHLAGAGTGAVTGLATAEDDASLADRLGRAGLGALAGLAVTAGGTAGIKVLQHMNAKSVAKAADDKLVADLAHAKFEGITPKAALPEDPKALVKAPDGNPAAIDPVKAAAIDKDIADASEAMVKAFETDDVSRLAGIMADNPAFNLSRVDGDVETKQMLDAMTATLESAIGKTTGGVKKLTSIEEMASEIHATPETVKNLYAGVENLSERMTAHRMLMTAAAEKVVALAKSVKSAPMGENPEMMILAVNRALAEQQAVVAYVKGAQTEIARAMSAMRLDASGSEWMSKELNAMVESLGGAKVNMEMIDKLSKLDSTVQSKVLNHFAENMPKTRTSDAIFAGFVNALLSGVKTHVVNLMGNGFSRTIDTFLTKPTAVVMGKIGKHFDHRNPADAIEWQDVADNVKGQLRGTLDAIYVSKGGMADFAKANKLFMQGDVAGARAVMEQADLGSAIKATATGRSYTDASLGSGQIERMGDRGNAMNHTALGLEDGTFLAKAVDVLGAVANGPTSFLNGSDEMFKSMIYRGELSMQANRHVRKLGLEGEAALAKIEEIMDTPTKFAELHEASIQAARVGTFTNRLGDSGRKLTDWLHSQPGARWIVPFVRTPINVLKYAGTHSPLGFVAKSVRDELTAGGARRDMALAKMAVGSTMMIIAGTMKANGMLTGGGDKVQSAEKLSGQDPQYSMKIGDEWIAYNRLDPLPGALFGVMADFMDISGMIGKADADKIAGATMLALQRNLTSKSYIKGLTDFMMVVGGNSQTQAGQYGKNFVASIVVPSLLRQMAQTGAFGLNDPVVRDARTLVDTIKARVPGWANDVPPVVDALGNDVVYRDGWGPDIASPFQITRENPSPLAQEVGRLNIDISRPEPKVNAVQGAPAVDLNPQQYYQMQKRAGALFKQHGEAMVTSDKYKALPEMDESLQYTDGYKSRKQTMISELYSKAVQQATKELIAGDKDLMSKVRLSKINKTRVALGMKPMDSIEQ